MKKIIIALVTVALLASCDLFRFDEPRADLGLERRQYTGKELRTDGYYLAKSTRENRLGLIVLYRNGVCLCTYIMKGGDDIKKYIENDVLQNKSYMRSLFEKPTGIGTFMITKRTIALQTWKYQNKRSTVVVDHIGEIINDTTLRVNTITEYGSNTSQFAYDMFHFVPFTNKPDSTTSFIK